MLNSPAAGMRTFGRLGATILSASLFLVLACAPLFAQANLGRILGSVRDSSGAPIPSATVTITDVDRGLDRTLMTDDSGD